MRHTPGASSLTGVRTAIALPIPAGCSTMAGRSSDGEPPRTSAPPVHYAPGHPPRVGPAPLHRTSCSIIQTSRLRLDGTNGRRPATPA